MIIWDLGFAFLVFLAIAYNAYSSDGPLSGRLLVGWLLLSAAWVTFIGSPGSQSISLLVGREAGQCALIVLVVWRMIACIPERVFPYWRHTIVAIALMEIVTATFFNTGNMGSITHSAAFVAAALAVNSWGFFAIPALFFIVYAKGGTAFAVLVAVLIGRERGAHRVPTFILCVGIGLIAYAMSGGDVFHLSERVSIWRESFDWWRANANPLFGTGLGTFKWISMYKIHPTPPLQLQMHCEWLRILFETGVVGLVLSLAFFGHLIKRAWGNPRILAALAALGVWGLTYNPLSTPVGVLFLGCLVRECLED